VNSGLTQVPAKAGGVGVTLPPQKHSQKIRSKPMLRKRCFYILTLTLALSELVAAQSTNSALYVSNFNANTVTAYDVRTGAFLRVAVQGGPELSGANGLAIAPDGSFYICGQFSNNVVHYDHQGKLIGILDPANLAGVSSPQGINFGPDGLLYVASFDNDKIVRYDPASGQFRDVFVQVTVPGIAHMGPIEPSFDSQNNLVVTTFDGQRILKYQGPGKTSNVTTQTTTAVHAKKSHVPGTLLKIFDLSTAPTGAASTLASYASGGSLLACILGTTCNGNTSRLFLVDAVNAGTFTGEIQEFLDNGTFVGRLVPNGTAGLVLTGGIAIGPDGNLYSANVRVNSSFQDVGSEILRFNPNNGQFLGILVPPGVGLNVPFAMRFGTP